MKLLNLWLIICLLNSTAAMAKECSNFIEGLVLAEVVVKGQIVMRKTTFPLVDWDPNSQYDRIVLTKEGATKLKNPVLKIQYKAKDGSDQKTVEAKKITPLEEFKEVKVFQDFQPTQFFKFSRPGTYSVQVASDAKVVCSEKHLYSLGH